MLQTAGLPDVPVYVSKSPNSPVGRTVVMGLGPSRRIVVTDTLVAGDSPQEVLYSVAYEVGHVMHGDLLLIALIEGGIIIFFSALAVVVADRIGFRRDDDPLSRLALVGALLALLYLAAVPARNAALRAYDFDADRFAVALTGDPASAIRALVRDTDQNMVEVCPEMLAVSFLNTAPSPGDRVARINGVRNTCP
jgi:STE24 endopeptidase